MMNDTRGSGGGPWNSNPNRGQFLPTGLGPILETSSCNQDASTKSPVDSAMQPANRRIPDSMELVPTNFRASDFEFQHVPVVDDSDQRLGTWSLCAEALGSDAGQLLVPGFTNESGQSLSGTMTIRHPISLTQDELNTFHISQDVTSCAFAFPVSTAAEAKSAVYDAYKSDLAFLFRGGFVYFDRDGRLLDVRTVFPATSSEKCLWFQAPQRLTSPWYASIQPHRWMPIGCQDLYDVGIRYFAWLLPGEKLAGRDDVCPRGGFAYIFHEPSEATSMQAMLDVVLAVVDVKPGALGCPKCDRPMEWSDYNEGLYAKGWSCENFQHCQQRWSRERTKRWFCWNCHVDVCDACCTKRVR